MNAMQILVAIGLLCACTAARSEDALRVDPSTLHHKVLCGYQGWFRCPGDGAGQGWRHWGRGRKELLAQNLTVEMWPDLSEYGADEKFPVPGFTNPDGTPAHLFSSANAQTVQRHFRWMQQYGIDGAFVQRFLVSLNHHSTDDVLEHCRAAARKSGRVYAVCYDLSGTPADKIFDTLTGDWKWLVDKRKLTADKHYLRHNGKPVLFVWGFYVDRFDAKLAHQIIDFFHADGPYQVTLVGGCQWYWRREKDPEWSRAFRRFDVISPWNVGNVTQSDGRKRAATDYWKDDAAEARRHQMAYLPVIYPGFGWRNLKGEQAAPNDVPRLGGKFFWRQFTTAAELKLEMAYVAMFDEVDEATAIFKVTNQPPTQARFQTYEGLPSDWYLRLTGEGAKLLRGERPWQREIPIKP